jgi:hypothetical protein
MSCKNSVNTTSDGYKAYMAAQSSGGRAHNFANPAFAKAVANHDAARAAETSWAMAV